MGAHDQYGKKLMKLVAGNDFKATGKTVHIDYKAGKPARIDGTVGDDIAVEIESRVSKQIRGAVFDLISHKYKKKLLVILPVHANNPQITLKQSQFQLSIHILKRNFRVVVTKGHGKNHKFKEDRKIIKKALTELGVIL